jgi:sugar lactone lactonase YvrE
MRRSTILFALLLTVLLSLPGMAQDVITTKIGGGPNNMPALDANLYTPYGLALDSSGNYYIAVYNAHRVFKVNTSGTLTVVAGSGAFGYSGDGIAGGAANADLYHPYGAAVDGSGNIYIADFSNCVVRKVDTSGTITTVAGNNVCGYSGDTGKGTAAQLNGPAGVALDGLGSLYIADYYNCVVRRLILATNIISTYAGNHTCGYSGDTGNATSAELSSVAGVAADTAGNLYIADTANYVIRKVTKSNGKINTIAGNHTAGFSGDGGPATSAEMNQVFNLAVNGGGTTVTFPDFYNQRVRQFTVGGNIGTVAGTGTAGFSGDGGAATSADLYYPEGVALTSAGAIYVSDSNNNRVRKFTVGGNISTVAGNGSPTVETQLNPEAPQAAVLQYPYGLATDATNNILVAERANCEVRELVHSTNLLNDFAGDGTCGFSGDNGKAAAAELNQPYGVAKDNLGNVYIADTTNFVIRMVNSAGTITTFAGKPGQAGFSGDGGPATSALLYYPYGVAADNKGSVYIADNSNYVIRKVTAGTITTIAGIGGRNGYSGDGGPAVAALLSTVTAVAVDPAGNVFIADYGNCRVRAVSAATGIITTVAGNGSCSFSGDGVATENSVGYPQGVAVDANDNLFIGDYFERVRWVSPSGFMTTIAGNGNAGYNGDGGPATNALLYAPAGTAVDTVGNILVSDQNNFRVRSISAFPALNTDSGSLAFGLTSVGNTSTPQTITLSALGPVTISNISVSGAFSEADDCPSSMTNGSKCVMYVYFAPTGAGTQNGSVTINSNGFFNPVTSVNLTGLGSAISVTGAPINFGNALVKTTTAVKTVTVKNAGTTAVTMGAITLNETTDYHISSNTCPASGSLLAGGASCAIGLTFTPASTGVKKGTVIINDSDPSSPQLAGLTGTGTSNVSLSPTSIVFPATAVGLPSAAQKITLTNNSGVSITLGNPAVTVTGPFLNAAATTCTPDLIIANTGTCVVYAQFKPTNVGFVAGSISVSDSDVTSPQSVALQGTGTGIKFTPGAISFGSVAINTQVSSTVTITNVGSTPVAFTGAEISGPNSPDFSDNYTDNPPCNNSATSPLLPGGTCTLTVYFYPKTTGAKKATYSVFDNSPGSPQSLVMTGTGH